MIALRDLRPMLARLLYSRSRVEELKREQVSLSRCASPCFRLCMQVPTTAPPPLPQVSLSRCVRLEIKRLVEADEVVRGLYHMRSGDGSTILSTNDWERVRLRDQLREARESNEEGTVATTESKGRKPSDVHAP
jgi:hypothetical protein